MLNLENHLLFPPNKGQNQAPIYKFAKKSQANKDMVRHYSD